MDNIKLIDDEDRDVTVVQCVLGPVTFSFTLPDSLVEELDEKLGPLRVEDFKSNNVVEFSILWKEDCGWNDLGSAERDRIEERERESQYEEKREK